MTFLRISKWFIYGVSPMTHKYEVTLDEMMRIVVVDETTSEIAGSSFLKTIILRAKKGNRASDYTVRDLIHIFRQQAHSHLKSIDREDLIDCIAINETSFLPRGNGVFITNHFL